MKLTFRHNEQDWREEWTVYRFCEDGEHSASLYAGWIRRETADDDRLVCIIGQYTKFTADELLEIGNYMKKLEEEERASV